jgi:hypothetical protein
MPDATPPGAGLIGVCVVYALPGRACVFQAHVPAGATVDDAIRACGILRELPQLAGVELELGVFGRPCALHDAVREGDRIEVYRPLQVDPKAARRLRAAAARR